MLGGPLLLGHKVPLFARALCTTFQPNLWSGFGSINRSRENIACWKIKISRDRIIGTQRDIKTRTQRSKMDKSTAASQHVKSKELCTGKWLSISEITYKDPTGKERKWETVSRTTKIGDGADGVVIVPIFKQTQKPDSVILVKQYRPPMKTYSLEFPAGLIDKGEDPLEAAVREMKEETGYTITPIHTSPGVSLDPGLGNSTINMVIAEINGDEDGNKNPLQQQEESEFIEVISTPVDGLLNTLNDYMKEGVVVHSIVYTYALTLSVTNKS